MDINTEIAKVFETAIERRERERIAAGEPPTELDLMSLHARLVVTDPKWLKANLAEFGRELSDEIQAAALAALTSDAMKYVPAVCKLRDALHDIAYEGADVEAQA